MDIEVEDKIKLTGDRFSLYLYHLNNAYMLKVFEKFNCPILFFIFGIWYLKGNENRRVEVKLEEEKEEAEAEAEAQAKVETTPEEKAGEEKSVIDVPPKDGIHAKSNLQEEDIFDDTFLDLDIPKHFQFLNFLNSYKRYFTPTSSFSFCW